MMNIRVRPLVRKLKYVVKVADVYAIVETAHRFEQILDLLRLQIGFDILFRTLMDIYLQFNLHFDFTQFEWNPVDFTGFTLPEFKLQFETIEKARYGISRYDYSVYDPEQVSPKQLERFAWEATYHLTHHREKRYRVFAKTVMDYLSTLKQVLARKGVADHYVDNIYRVLLKVEGKVLNTAYWGFAVWDGQVWASEDAYDQRISDDYKTERKCETINVYECHWDMDSWDYARWVDGHMSPETIWQEQIEEFIDEKVAEFHSKVEPAWQGTFLLQRHGRMHIQGGYHQIRLQNINSLVKRICRRHGVPVTQMYAYIAFAHELKYMTYEGFRKYKQWRKVLTADDIVSKYASMGLDKSILEEIRSALGL